MNKRILLIELCNYEDYPLGGHLSFAKQLIKAFGNELALVGITTDDKIPVGCWTKRIIEGIEYDYFSVKKIYPSPKKSIIPGRIKAYFSAKRYRKEILAYGSTNIIIQTPEVFFNFKNHKNLNICLRLPGLGNPLRISRYAYGKLFAEIYENIFFKAINKANVLLAAADNDAISDFIKRSKNKFDKSKLIQFPTRFDDSIFYPKEKKEARNYIGVSDNDTLIVTSGRLNHFKGWKLMIDAFALFHENNNNSKFIFLGDGEDKAKIENYIFEKNLIRSVLLKGRVDHKILADYLNAADLFIMGSYAEGWSTSLVEAVACATPVCTTNFSSANELVQNSVNGFVLENRDEMAFAAKMREALELPNPGFKQKAIEIQRLSVSNLKNEFLKYSKIK